ncbi:MAG: AraC family transcriptional regulator [Sphingorhabdus sp.]
MIDSLSARDRKGIPEKGGKAAAAGRQERQAGWQEAKGSHRLFGGSTPIGSCEAHFHETFIIGHIRRGSAIARINGASFELRAGKVLLVNPFDIVECDSDPLFEYDVCYPDRFFMQQVLLEKSRQGGLPRFSRHLMAECRAAEIGRLLSELFAADQPRPPELVESDIRRALASELDLVIPMRARAVVPSFVEDACGLIERHLEDELSVAEISARVGKGRSEFARVFRDTTGLPPSVYIRQLRLARALERVRNGEPLAEIALLYGFFDQAHFTRAFKRVYGTAPGRLARDISRCRACN